VRRFIEPLVWIGLLVIAGCATLKEPVLDPTTGQPVMRPDGTPQTKYDSAVETSGSLLSLLTGNALLAPFVVAGGAAMRDKVVGPKGG
jgi:hypothetical protein